MNDMTIQLIELITQWLTLACVVGLIRKTDRLTQEVARVKTRQTAQTSTPDGLTTRLEQLQSMRFSPLSNVGGLEGRKKTR